MCDKHEPVKVYDSGGTQVICIKCGKPLSEWKQNSGNGKHDYSRKEETTVQNVQQEVK